MKSIFFIFLLLFNVTVYGENLTISTWNIEHLGTSGRGFGGGYGGGNIPLRTTDQLDLIATFIHDDLQADVIALQEIGITHTNNGRSKSKQLDRIVQKLGDNWLYYLPPKHSNHGEHSMYVGYLWNSSRVRSIAITPLNVPQLNLAGKALFDRIPLVGYFEAHENERSKNDFVLINIHLASGQNNDENHLIAMTLIEYQLNTEFSGMGIKESDRIILGDFNDNPYSTTPAGQPNGTPALYQHMSFKGYQNFVTDDFHSTRMDGNLRSIIDHVLVNKSAKRHVIGEKASIWLPPSGSDTYGQWRQTYSDHFPISLSVKIGADDDAD